MSIESTLKKEGITVLNELGTMEINSIASNISEKILKAFPEHGLERSDLFVSICRLNMYVAYMQDNAMAKYFYRNNSIYFNCNMNLNILSDLALHEIIHYIQTIKDSHGRLKKMGLSSHSLLGDFGVGINEAAVQYMASLASNQERDSVKYYNMNFSSISPDYYPIETALLEEMMYFTGNYPLIHSTLYSNDIFKNTFIARSNEKAFYEICTNFDLIIEYENKLSEYVSQMDYYSEDPSHLSKIKNLNETISALKQVILNKTLETQNIILTSCFENSFNCIKTLKDITVLKDSLYNFKDVIISSNSYNFYNEFYVDMMNRLAEKREYILKYGDISSLDSVTNELANVEEHTYGYMFFKQLFQKLNILVEEKIREKEI